MKPLSIRSGIVMKAVCLLLIILTIQKNYAQKSNSSDHLKNYISSNIEKLGIKAADIKNLEVTHEYTDPSTGIDHMYATQKINGLTLTSSHFSLHTKGNVVYDANNLVPISSYSVKPLAVNVTSLAAVQALMNVVESGNITAPAIKQPAKGTEQITIYQRSASPIFDIPVRLVYYTNERFKSIHPAWEVQMMESGKKHYWVAYIDAANGKILDKTDLILHCEFGGGITDAGIQDHTSHQHVFSENAQTKNEEKFERFFENTTVPDNKYRVYDLPLESPGDTVEQAAPHQLGIKSGDVNASPDGWHRVANSTTYQYTRGNNVWSFQDPSPGPLGGVPSADPTRTAYANNGPAGTPPLNEPFIFDYPVNLAGEPSAYQNGAIVNLFYWNNLMHDVFYNMGFTEAAGNFQDSHTFSTGTKTGGTANDAVLAQAQDGGGTNNANFLTTPDGTPGQMQMYLWTAAFPDSLVRVIQSSSGIPPAGKKYIALQGSFNTSPLANTNLFTNPQENKQFVIVQKNPLSVVGTDEEGCSTGQQSVALPPGNDVTNKIVLIRRGSCSFAEKVLGAQQGGAAGVIIINNVDGPPIAMGGADAPGNLITIPAVMISKADGEELLTQLRNPGVSITGSLKRDNPPAAKRDGDLDNGVIAHEYGHGISTRLTAPNTVGPLGGSEQGGEGWSDFMALYMTTRANDLSAPTAGHPFGVLPVRSIGNYVTYQPANGRGIRPTPYSIDFSSNASTFKDIGKGGEITVPHGVGYIWCTMMYEMLQKFIDQYGINDDVYNGAVPVGNNPPATAKGNNIAMRLILEGIKLQGTSPTFERQRNAILKADTLLYGGQHACMIWDAFAKRGLGASAKSNSNGVGDEVEAYDVPMSCNSNQKRVMIVKNGPVKLVNGSVAQYSIAVTNKYAVPVSNVLVTDTLPATLIFNSASDGGTLEGNVVKWTIDLGANQTKSFTLNTTVNTPGSSVEAFSDDHENGTANWIVDPAVAPTTTTQWTYTTDAAKAYSGSKYWFAPNGENTNTNLRSATSLNIPTNAELVFIHKYSTEPKYDGGVLEVSEDNIQWTYIPPTKFVRGGYNDIITTTNNPAIGPANLAAFSGTSPGYVVSIAKLDEYAGKNIYIRFRFTCDVGTIVPNEGWSMDDIYILQNRTEIANVANALTTPADPIRENEGSNARNSTSSFVLGGTILPNSLGALNAALKAQTVNLQWKTFNEVGTAYFEIERKGTAEANFTLIGKVTSSGFASSGKTYEFADAGVLTGNRYQYRVKMVNKNGAYYYTNVALVSIGGNIFNVSIYPNPAANSANISISNPEGGKITIQLFDVMGKKLATLLGANAPSQLIPLPVNQLQPGTYWVEVSTGIEKKTLKLVVAK